MDNAKNAQATPDGVLDNGNVTGYSAIIRALNDGKYDANTVKALRLLACVWEAAEKGWYRLSVAKEIILWRWLVVTVFVIEQRELNGIVDVQNDSGGTDKAIIYRSKKGGMSIYPGPERFCMASNVESVAIEKYGADVGLEKALQIYKAMVEYGSNGFELSAWGRDAFQILHDSFIEQLQTEGMPDMPVMH